MILYQVNKLLFRRNLYQLCRRNIQNSVNLHPLQSRKLLKVSGEDVSSYLQGLITNDMRHFEEGAKCMYAMFLNNKGRVLYDSLIYKWVTEDSFLIECDSKITETLHKHLKLYKLKRKLEFTDVNNEFKVWALIAPTNSEFTSSAPNVNLYKDPRLTDLGFRVVASAKLNGSEIAECIGKEIQVENNEENYKYLRYKLGVSEGCDDLQPGSSFPLEANCDYLHGVSFHKGCYIGQELTARVHHTGVVRKRIMPLKFNQDVKLPPSGEPDLVITDVNNPKSSLGKLKSAIRDYGLGLVRIKEALESKDLTVGRYKVEAFKPNWWPVEAPKDKLNLSKVESKDS